MAVIRGHLVAAGLTPSEAAVTKYNALRRVMPTTGMFGWFAKG
jgi:hypothetical protein